MTKRELDDQQYHRALDLFNEFDTDHSGTIDTDEAYLVLQKFGLKLSKGQTAKIVKSVDVDNSGELDQDEFINLIRTAVSASSFSGHIEKSGSLSGEDIDSLREVNRDLFELLRKLWSRASDPSDLNLIRRNYGVVKLSNVLTLDNPFAIKGATAILLYLSVSDGKVDFISDYFYNNLAVSLENDGNESNYLWLIRLLRLLQLNKDFGDWMLSKSGSRVENRIWKRLVEIAKETDDEELKREASRALKEGMRAGAVGGQFCIIPEKVAERMKKEIIWYLSDEDLVQLDELSGSKSYSYAPAAATRRSYARGPFEANGNSRLVSTPPDSFESPPGSPEFSSDTDLDDEYVKARIQDLQIEMDFAEKENLRKLHNAIDQLTKEVRTLKAYSAATDTTVSDLKKEVGQLKGKVNTQIHESINAVQQLVRSSLSAPATAPAESVNARLSLSRAELYNGLPTSPVSFSPQVTPVDTISLPHGWDKKLDPVTNKYYYFDRISKRTQWHPPE